MTLEQATDRDGLPKGLRFLNFGRRSTAESLILTDTSGFVDDLQQQTMSKTNILDRNKSYTFSRYAEMPFATGDILAEFGVGFERKPLDLRQVLPIDSSALRTELEENLTLVDPSSEIARREALIFPVLRTVCKFSQSSLKIEYPVRVNSWLRGTLDYFLPFAQNLVVIEAKNADLARGFTQLAVELIALDQWVESETPLFYGALRRVRLGSLGHKPIRSRQILTQCWEFSLA